jgi:hypothetical protein
MIKSSSKSAENEENLKIRLKAIQLFLGGTLADHPEDPKPENLGSKRPSKDDVESLAAFDELNSLLPQCKRLESIHNEIMEYLAKAKEIIASSSQSADTEDNRKIKLEAIQLFLQGVRSATSDDDLFEDALDIFESEVLDGEDEYDQSYSKDDASAIDDLGLSSHGEQAFSTYEALEGAES